ncbi:MULTISPECIES: hypothetical protein [unclassified Streptomyces]|uniref:hypothetical protein n=1 Tax=unclassified Streptomyces TaxID=2593676 RepID=UPI002256A527|nr:MULTISPECIES: hypothetical protein [unclassified Streptomyces]MCX4884643.1 hypothetical protein [Streptomyces sp. NBC_00847]MCX5424790.1 hypothetical protein [Streptomyces sp. NBC_00078]
MPHTTYGIEVLLGMRRRPAAPARFRDSNAITAHIQVSPATWETTGRILLGIPTDTTRL